MEYGAKSRLGRPTWDPPKEASTVPLPEARGSPIFRRTGWMKEEAMEAFFGALGRLARVSPSAERRP